MKSIKVDLPKNLKTIEVHTFADWHIGDHGCKMDEIREQIEHVRTTENAYCILNGDLLNSATKNSVSDIYAEEIMPMDGVKLLVGMLEPIKDKIIFVSQGNHENRFWKESGLDITYLVCSQLGITDRYSREGGVLFLRFGDIEKHHRPVLYTFYVAHGSGGGGRKEGSKVIRLAELSSIVDTDIYLHGHTHLPLIMKESFFRLSYANSSVARVEKLYVNASSRLEYGGYGQVGEFKPSATACPVIYLSGTKHAMQATL